ncbi:pilus assembly FimT family protein [Ectothiorhodospira shaposhnikovii]|uniref:pilus assembly FimT family protein n=1 Tax=Ectothiorhodospira shaposhnikovii TaxID=1054 RepID=UPI001EE94EA2|nr:type II secretion system protein [Ectothiorhodospira shaposhnikovii]MCG5514378.1 type II secretion system GspH family protein [Ectothiorhodospira shaposhnikovii]
MSQHGLTLLEMLLIMVLIGALAAVVWPKINIDGFQDYRFANELTQAFRDARRIASDTGKTVCMKLDPDGYEVFFCHDPDDTYPIPHPSRPGDYSGTGNIIDPKDPLELKFNPLGLHQPVDAAVTVTIRGGHTIEIQPITGYARTLR